MQPVLWGGVDPIRIDDTHYVASFAPPPTGWLAFFFEVSFESPDSQLPFVFTSQVNIIPDVYPFPPCYGDSCKGKLL